LNSESHSNDWAMVISGLVNKPVNNTIWSVVQRLVLGAATYFIWQERNIRRMEHRKISVDGLFKVVFDNVRLKLMGLKLKWTSDVIKASKIWNLPMKRDKDVVSMLGQDSLEEYQEYKIVTVFTHQGLACFGTVMVYVAVQIWILCISQAAHGLDWYLWRGSLYACSITGNAVRQTKVAERLNHQHSNPNRNFLVSAANPDTWCQS
ncbi:hypothetical protein Tco_1339919, partial [Tanacetum coccineum]